MHHTTKVAVQPGERKEEDAHNTAQQSTTQHDLELRGSWSTRDNPHMCCTVLPTSTDSLFQTIHVYDAWCSQVGGDDAVPVLLGGDAQRCVVVPASVLCAKHDASKLSATRPATTCQPPKLPSINTPSFTLTSIPLPLPNHTLALNQQSRLPSFHTHRSGIPGDSQLVQDHSAP